MYCKEFVGGIEIGYLEWLGKMTLAIIMCVIVMIIFLVIYETGYMGEFLDYGTYKFVTGLACGIILNQIMYIGND